MVVSRAAGEAPALAPGLLPIPGMLDLGPAGVLRCEEAAADDTSGTPRSIVIDVDRLAGRQSDYWRQEFLRLTQVAAAMKGG